MKAFIKITILLFALSFAGCWNMYNDVLDDLDDEYNFFLAVINNTSEGVIATFSFNFDNKPIISSKKTIDNSGYPTFGAIHPSGNYLYVPNHGSGWERNSIGNGTNLSMYQINNDGSLSSLGTPNTISTGTGPWTVKIHPSGNFAYVTNDGSNDISIYRVNSNGALENFGATTTTGTRPKGLAIDPTGKYLYVANYTGSSSGSISMYNISNDGSLSELPSSPISAGSGNYPWDITIHPSGNYAYVTIGNGQIFIYYINNGALESSGLSPKIESTNPYNMAFHHSGDYIYVADYGKVDAYSVNASNGNLSFLNSIQDSGNIGGSTCGIVIHPAGKFLYTSAGGSEVVAFIGLLNNGLLDLNNYQGYGQPSGVPDINPVGLAIFRKKIH